MVTQGKGLDLTPIASDISGDKPGSIFAVGLTDAQGQNLPAQLFGALGAAAVKTNFADLTRERLWSAIVVVSPLVAPKFDAIDMASRLAEEQFTGRYYAFTSAALDATLIRREIAEVAPDLSFDIIRLNPTIAIVPDGEVRT